MPDERKPEAPRDPRIKLTALQAAALAIFASATQSERAAPLSLKITIGRVPDK
jgi:hypothetical protein